MKWIFLFVYFAPFSLCQAQVQLSRKVMGSLGGELKSENIHLQTTGGEPVVGAGSGRQFFLVAGFQQALEPLATSLQIEPAFSSQLSIAPNPVNAILQITLKTEYPGKIQFLIADQQGRTLRLEPANILAGETFRKEWDVSNLGPGGYFLLVKAVDGQLLGKQTFIRL